MARIVTDLGPNKKRLAQLFRMLGSSGGERRNAFAALERLMQHENVTWNDIGDVIAGGGDKYSEAEMEEFALAARAEGIEEGIKIGIVRAGNGGGNGDLTLPSARDMAEYCHARPHQLKDDSQREFIEGVYVTTQHGRLLGRGPLGYLVSLYIKHGGKVRLS
jgi:hypothetical protein